MKKAPRRILLALALLAVSLLAVAALRAHRRNVAWVRHSRARMCLVAAGEALTRAISANGSVPVGEGWQRLGEGCDAPSLLVTALVDDGYLTRALVCDPFGNPMAIKAVSFTTRRDSASASLLPPSG